MIAVSRFPKRPAVEPVAVTVVFTRADLGGLKEGRYFAVPGRDLGLEGTDFLFMAAVNGRPQAEGRLTHVLNRFKPDAPDDYKFPVVQAENKFWHMPLYWRESDAVLVTALSRSGALALEARETLTYRQRLFGAGVLDMPAGVHRLASAEKVVNRAFRRGEALLPGSVHVALRLAADRDAAVRLARRSAGVGAGGPGAADDAAEVQFTDPPAWLAHWPAGASGSV